MNVAHCSYNRKHINTKEKSCVLQPKVLVPVSLDIHQLNRRFVVFKAYYVILVQNPEDDARVP